MSIIYRLIIAFSLVLAVGAGQSIIVVSDMNKLSGQIGSEIDKPLVLVDTARGAWEQFRNTSIYVAEHLEGSRFYEPRPVIAEFRKKADQIAADLKRVALASKGTEALAKQAADAFLLWRDGALVLLGETPATSIPTKAVMSKREADVGRALYDLVTAALVESDRIKEGMISEIQSILYWVMALAAFATIAGFLIAAVSAVSITRPISRVVKAMNELANGNLGVDVAGQTRKDEIGDIARALEVFRRNGVEREHLMTTVEQERAEAEQRKRALEDLAAAFMQKADSLKAVLDKQAHIMKACATSLETATSATEDQTTQGLAASSDAASNVQTVAAAAEQLTASTKRIAEQAINAREITRVASEKTRLANNNIAELSSVTNKIGSILEAIGGIAAQTNLLSLNATIEAARAGEAGKGFAVVASEVKALANQTAKATAQVAELVTAIGASTDTAVGSIAVILEQMHDVNALSDSIAAAVVEQENATLEIAESAARAARSTEGASENSVKVADVMRSTRAEVDSVQQAATSLFAAMGVFTAGIDEFLGSISDDLKDRRSYVRHPLVQPVTIESGGHLTQAELTDISLGGASLRSETYQTVDKRVDVVFAEGPEPATIVWTEDREFGVRFDQPLQSLPISIASALKAA